MRFPLHCIAFPGTLAMAEVLNPNGLARMVRTRGLCNDGFAVDRLAERSLVSAGRAAVERK